VRKKKQIKPSRIQPREPTLEKTKKARKQQWHPTQKHGSGTDEPSTGIVIESSGARCRILSRTRALIFMFYLTDFWGYG